jgi:hypothetical protein
VKVTTGSLDGVTCPWCDEPLGDLHDLLDDVGHASGFAFVACHDCHGVVWLETETIVYAFTGRRKPPAGGA